ncbi:hypothetical protein Pmar_PMAR006118 [Perkinsus marinus ATCC 50983]|uniref:Uncharacterized protein n=1 Tax=Perkinsus marinus (strain ATCC 50983 / TXsc) TaxID=423536 RepID=C5LA95_PERM5|nr:hypothetical protein Pmar_PMAR006118 [Perkinsus marinus ATCC 50983]EER06351.1 hypothetical protein Pmar_PMAR006118 [Perkinsus marinus ATCC 50983]|eukprot:XP_002774535.1 hypothetical protein Pmar_PMAR006118 [Perkinsus marinus ATCC 50983]
MHCLDRHGQPGVDWPMCSSHFVRRYPSVKIFHIDTMQHRTDDYTPLDIIMTDLKSVRQLSKKGISNLFFKYSTYDGIYFVTQLLDHRLNMRDAGRGLMLHQPVGMQQTFGSFSTAKLRTEALRRKGCNHQKNAGPSS